jgi:hypothetical protein
MQRTSFEDMNCSIARSLEVIGEWWALRQWGDEWSVGKGKEPVLIVHKTCGKRSTGVLTCDNCGARLHRADMRVVPGPGLEDRGMLRQSELTSSSA